MFAKLFLYTLNMMRVYINKSHVHINVLLIDKYFIIIFYVGRKSKGLGGGGVYTTKKLPTLMDSYVRKSVL